MEKIALETESILGMNVAVMNVTFIWSAFRNWILSTKKACAQRRPLHGSVFLFNIFHDVGNVAFQNFTQLINSVGGNVVAAFHGIIGGTGEAELHQPIRGNSPVSHGFEKRFITYHTHSPPDVISII